MTKKRSETATGKRAGPGASRAAHLSLGLLLIVAGGAAVQVLGASATQEPIPAAAASATSPPTHGQVVSPATVAGNSAQTLNVYGGRMRPLVTVESGESQTLNIYGPEGHIIAQVVQDGREAQEVRHLFTDHPRSTRAVLNAEGDAVARFEYAPYGDGRTEGTAAAEVAYRYTGHRYDDGQAIYETPYRGYDPTVGRFLSVDPDRETASPYAYVTNNPVLYKDPIGKGRVGTVITPQVKGLAADLIAQTREFDSTSRFYSKFEDPIVVDFLKTFAKLYDSYRGMYDQFAHRIMQKGDAHSLARTFFDLGRAAPDLPRVKAEQRDSIKSSMEEFGRLLDRYQEFKARRAQLFEEVGSNWTAYYRSSRALEVMKDPTESSANVTKGFGNCSYVALCIAGRIAVADPEVNVEVFESGKGIDHAFVVVGRDPSTDASKPLSWNKDAHIVDGWHGYLDPAHDIYAKGINTKSFAIDASPVLSFTFD